MPESQAGQNGGGRCTADSGPTHHDDMAVLVVLNLSRANRHLFERDEDAARDMAEVIAVFVRLTHIEQERGGSALPLGLDFLGGKLAHAIQRGETRKLDGLVFNGGLVRLENFLDFIRQREVEVVHQIDIFLATATGHARICLFFFTDSGLGMPPIIMTGKDQCAVGQRKQFMIDAVVLGAWVALGKVGPPGAVDKQGIAGEHPVHGVEAHAVGRVAWGREHVHGERPDSDELPVFDMPVNVRGGGAPMHDHRRVGERTEFPTARQMIGVGVRIDNAVKRIAIIGEQGEIAVGFFQDWINEGDFTCFFAPNQIGLGGAAVEFAKQHDERSSSEVKASSMKSTILFSNTENRKIMPRLRGDTYRFLGAFLLGLLCLSCESVRSPGPRQQTETERDVLGLRGPVRSLSIFRADLVKQGDKWESQAELPIRTDRFDRRGHLTERLSYDPAGTLRERTVLLDDARTNEREVRRYGPENSLSGRIVSSYVDHGALAESRSYSTGDVLTERAVFQYDANGRETESQTYQPGGELKNRTASRYDVQGNIEEQLWYDAADTLVKKVVYQRDFQGTLVTRVSFVYAANSRLSERTDIHFNNNGDPTERIVYVDDGRQRHTEMFTYRYDAFGNWTTQTVKRQVVNKNASYFRPTRIIFRVFAYYERGGT